MITNHVNRYTIRQYAPTVLSAIGYLGIAITSVLSFRAKIKYDEYTEKEPEATVKNVVKAAAPPVISGAITAGCFAISRSMDKKTIAALSASTMALSAQIAEMKAVMEEKLDTEVYEDIIDTVDRKLYSLPSDRTVVLDLDGKLYLEEYTHLYFVVKPENLLDAMLKLNRNYQIRGGIASLYEFFRVLGVKKSDIKRFGLGWTEYIGWHANFLEAMYGKYTIDHIFIDEDKYSPYDNSFITLEWDVPLTPICDDPPPVVMALSSVDYEDLNKYQLLMNKEDVRMISESILDEEVE